MVFDRMPSAGCSGDLRAGLNSSTAGCGQTGVWAAFIARDEHTSGSALGVAASQSDGGFIAGADGNFGGRGSIGFALGWTEGRLTQSAAATYSKDSNVFASVYGGGMVNGFNLSGEAFFMHSGWSVKRNVAGYGAGSSNPNGDTVGAALQLSHALPSTGFQANARLSHADFTRRAVTETGASLGTLALATDSQSTSSSRMEIGVMLAQRTVALDNGVMLSPSFRVGLSEDLAGGDRTVRSNLALISNTAFVGTAVRADPTSGVLAGALKAKMSDRFDLTADLRGRFSGNQTEGSVSLSAVYRF